MSHKLSLHPVATLFPDMPAREFAALVEDIRQHGVKVPVLVHGGQILDGRHRYRACQQLGIPCPQTEWTGREPWLEVQSRNLVRRHLGKDQICAIRLLAGVRFPELTAPILAAREEAKQRKAQAIGEPRGHKALSGPRDRQSAADAIGRLLGVSGSTVKRVDRLARTAPELIPKVASGELTVKKALRDVSARACAVSPMARWDVARSQEEPFRLDHERRRLQQRLEIQGNGWPDDMRPVLLDTLAQLLSEFASDRNDFRTLEAKGA
jgi:hypothetical protein